jgi:Peptidase family M28
MRRRIPRLELIACLLVVLGAAGHAPESFGPTDAITVAGLERHLRFIASDELEGRDALSPGFRAAAGYVAATLTRIGATPAGDAGSYFQHVAIRRTSLDPQQAAVTLGGLGYRYGDDFVVSVPGRATGAMAYVGSGWRVPRTPDPFAGVDVAHRVLVVVPGPPPRDLGGLVRGSDYTTASDNAAALGAAGVVEIASKAQLGHWDRYRRTASRGTLTVDRLTPPEPALPSILAGPRLAAALFRGEPVDGATIAERAAGGHPGASFPLRAERTISIDVPTVSNLEDTMNVVAVVEGSDPVLRREYVALGAHLDHIGRRSRTTGPAGSPPADDINNGADDDGSGVVALLQMAEAVAAGPRPRRSLLFVWHTGEEEGSWGARYFTAFPTVPLDSIVAQLNVDMIGRAKAPGDLDPADASLTGPDEVYIVGSRRLSRDLGDVCARVDRAFLGLALNYKYDAPGDPERIYERSDHYEYALKGIPVAFFFTGLHADYHRPSDEVDRIDFVKLQKVARTVLATAWTLANEPGRPRLDRPPSTH